jgi:hypothetical protein
MIMSQDNFFHQLKIHFIKYTNFMHDIYLRFIKNPCINFINFLFYNDQIIINDTSNSPLSKNNDNIPITQIMEEKNDLDNDTTSITKRISYTDSSSNDTQEISIHRSSISMYIHPDYINKNE